MKVIKDLKAFFDPDPEKLNYRPDWKSMSAGDKASYIWTYYKIPIIIGLVVLYFIGYMIVHWVSRTNEILYAGSVNMFLTEEQQTALTDEYTSDPAFGFGKRDRVSFMDMGYISDDPNAWVSQVAGATQVKLLASIAADQLDVIFMDQAALDVFSQDEMLLDLAALAEGRVEAGIESESEAENTGDEVSTETMEYLSGISGMLVESGGQRKYGIDVTDTRLFRDADFDQPVYAAILAQTSRINESAAYIRYVIEGNG